MPNLNSEAHFAQSPLGVDIPRSTFDRSCGWKGSYNSGKLNCMFVDEILPGDTVDMKVSRLDRMTTPLYPVLDDAFIDQYFFFVPNRLVWKHWKEFNGENNVSAWVQPVQYTIPTIDAANSDRAFGDLGDQMGIPLPFSGGSIDYFNVNCLPLRSYRLCWNTWFRDQNTQDPQLINDGDTETDDTLFSLLPVNRVHDRFGSCLPSTQKGEAVKIALSGFLHVYPSDIHSLDDSSFATSTDGPSDFTWSDAHHEFLLRNVNTGELVHPSVNRALHISTQTYAGGSNVRTLRFGDSDSAGNSSPVIFSNLVAGQGAENTLGVDVNELRLAVQTQRILEKLSIGGEKPVAA